MKERVLKRAAKDRDVTDEHYLGRHSGNPHSVRNVNVPMGPRVGTEGAHTAKRGNFLDAKAERQPLADSVMAAFSGRAAELEANPGEHEVAGSGGIDSDSQVRRFAARKSKYKD